MPGNQQGQTWATENLPQWEWLFYGSTLLLPPGFVAALHAMPQWDWMLEAHWFHFQIVSLTSFVALVVALLVAHLTRPVADGRAFFVSLALSATAAIFLLHGLATPPILTPTFHHSVVWSAPLSLLVGAFLFGLASVGWNERAEQWMAARRGALALAVLTLCVLAWALALLSPALPLRLLGTVLQSVAAVTIVLALGASLRFWQAYQRQRRPLDGNLALALGLMANAVVPMVWAPQWHVSWWSYHVLLLAAFALALGAVAREYEQARHFHLLAYFAAIGAIAGAALTLVASELVVWLLEPYIVDGQAHVLRWTSLAIFGAMSFLLFGVLLQVVRRSSAVLSERAAALQRQQILLERARITEALVRIGLAMGATLELDEVLDVICEESLRLFGVDGAHLWLREGDELVGRAGCGHKAGEFMGLRRKLWDSTLVGARVVRQRKPLLINRAARGRSVNAELARQFDIQAILGVPLLREREVLGALLLFDTRNPDRFTGLDLEVATIFGQQAALALIDAQLYDEVQRQRADLASALADLRLGYEATLTALGSALDARDRETEGHSRRVTAYASLLAERMGITDRAEREAIERGALLHDVGKIGVPDAILHKPGQLDPDEWQQMRRHPAIGFNILRRIAFLQPALPVVLCHHESWDGTGYPQGLRGESIPLYARIFAVADTLDAITSTRPYRAARSFEAARDEIVRQRAIQFDPAVVDAFLSVPLNRWKQLGLSFEVPAAREG